MKLRHHLGHGVWMRFVSWAPDRELNPHLAHLADENPTGIIIEHTHEDGTECRGMVPFDTPANRRNDRPTWTVEQEEPLTLSPSILRRECGLHGFIREGTWVPA